MYVPAHFSEARTEAIADLIRNHPLATLVTAHAGGLVANHLPLFFDAAAGVLRGHMARDNPQWREQGDALAVFHGPQQYVSPSWYPSKAEHGRVVPTWNFAVVHVYGKLSAFEDPVRILANVTELTGEQESCLPNPWSVSDAPADYIQGLLRVIVGIEIRIERIEAKFKLSQNRPEADRESVAAAVDEAMARLMRGAIPE